jgi:hypothetical protein
MDALPLDTELGEERPQAEEDANAPPETIVVKMRGRPAGSKNKAKAENPTIETPQPDPVYTALMKRLDAMDGMLAQRQVEITNKKKEKAPPRPRKTPVRVERDISPPLREPASSQGKEQFRIQGSPRTASRQLMAHLHSHRWRGPPLENACIRTSYHNEND